MGRKYILLEVNEVPFVIWDRYARRHPSSPVASLVAQASQFETVTDDEGFVSASGRTEHAHITPWTTWPTLHRGVPNSKHGIVDIGQDLSVTNRNYPAVWQVFAEAGRRAGVFGSLHSYPLPDDLRNYAFYVPDPFAPEADAFPDVARPFQTFVLDAARASGRNVSSGVNLGAASRFLSVAPRLGIRPRTLVAITRQLADERREPHLAVRRRAIHSLLGFDVYRKLLLSTAPDFSSFFCNHAAAAMHRYWAAAYPDDYDEIDVGEQWRHQYGGEIDHAMQSIDSFIGELMDFCRQRPEFTLIVASSMGQGPTKGHSVTTELAVSDETKLMSGLGVPSEGWRRAPAMFPNFNVIVDEEYRDRFAASVASIEIAGLPLDYRQSDGGFFSLDFGQPDLETDEIRLEDSPISLSDVGLKKMVIQDTSLKCADHIRTGSLFSYSVNDVVPDSERRQVPLTAVAPSLIAGAGIEPPAHMAEDPLEALGR